jgi:AcrR family transcriptional regulator
MAQARTRISKDPGVRREEFLSAAAELFAQIGYEKTSVQAITEKVGVAKGLFYHYFASKVDLLNQLATWQADEFISTLPRHAADMEGDALQKLRDLASRSLRWKFEDARVLTRAYLEVMYREENRALRSAFMAEYTAALIPLFSEIIAEAAADGICQVDDPEIAAEMMFALGFGASERIAGLILSLVEHPENLTPLLARLRAWECGIERLLGMKADTLRLYDYEYVAVALSSLLDGPSGVPSKGQP